MELRIMVAPKRSAAQIGAEDVLRFLNAVVIVVAPSNFWPSKICHHCRGGLSWALHGAWQIEECLKFDTLFVRGMTRSMVVLPNIVKINQILSMDKDKKLDGHT